ncbi:hypothetical protein HPNQ4099_0540 [Helicobacter pylori NQ4099]|uniref:Uncharacterized protein n=2 Tax=Helicobacter pylori TaxID=210 RepID=J0IXL2_HELPX|nr:hypothetical protein HPNQ4099_0540 [Helicobacter pylori NQ4099]EJB34176.1 hypothetical protein HPNQ4076_0421 [Helicobacter pylori NQ4076]
MLFLKRLSGLSLRRKILNATSIKDSENIVSATIQKRSLLTK